MSDREIETLNIAHQRAWNEGRYADAVPIIARLRELRGITTRPIDRRDDDQKDFDEDQNGDTR
jgi:hypothetical protein